jgi:phosphonate degradation associated HDIG domain protein
VTVTDEIMTIVEARGTGAYFGESVSVVEHALQAAHFARTEGASDALVAAALLHDIGHLLEAVPSDIADWHADACHEQVGSAWLTRYFGSEVTDPVRLHVAAKRFLCATAPGYFAKLSAASVFTLTLQGGPMSTTEIAAFRRERCFREAVRVRLWDDRAKVAGLVTAPLAGYGPLIESLADRPSR